MTIGAHDLELIKKEIAGIQEFYNARMDKDIPPLKEEVDRITAQVTRIHDLWREGEKRAILSNYGGVERPRVPYGKYQGPRPAGPGIRAQPPQRPATSAPRSQPSDAGGVAINPEGRYGQHHRHHRG